jgi:hypothetical protein
LSFSSRGKLFGDLGELGIEKEGAMAAGASNNDPIMEL